MIPELNKLFTGFTAMFCIAILAVIYFADNTVTAYYLLSFSGGCGIATIAIYLIILKWRKHDVNFNKKTF